MRKISFILVALLIVCLFYLEFYAQNKLPRTIKIVIPTTQEGVAIDTKDLLGKPYLINVFATWCDSCGTANATLLKYSDKIDMYGISYLDVAKQTDAWLSTHGNPYKMVGQDYKGLVGRYLGISTLPSVIVVNAKGEIVWHGDGVPLTEKLIENELIPFFMVKNQA